MWRSTPSCIPPPKGELHHWHLTETARHPPELEPGLAQVVHFWQKWSHDLDRIRREISEEVEKMVDERKEHTLDWTSLVEYSEATRQGCILQQRA